MKKVEGSVTTYYIYDALGRFAAEYTSAAPEVGTSYVFTDMLGSVRAITSNAGVLQECYDYLPFGRMLSSADNGRSGCHPVSPDISANSNSRASQKFTGQPRDNGLKLDYFGARFYSASLGRFTTPDPVVITQDRMEQPHRLNLYAYASNNPINRIDPSGLEDKASPWQVGWEWLTGTGPGAHYFTDGDPFTEMLKKHSHIQELIKKVRNGEKIPENRFDYDLDGVGGIQKYLKDYSTLLTGGLIGNLAVTYLGSYELKYEVIDGVMHVDVYNSSTVGSLIHPPYFGYTAWWKNNISDPLNKRYPSTGATSAKEQHFKFTINLSE